MDVLKKIERFEKDGWEYKLNYSTGSHVLKQCLIKRIVIGDVSYDIIKQISEKGRISDYLK